MTFVSPSQGCSLYVTDADINAVQAELFAVPLRDGCDAFWPARMSAVLKRIKSDGLMTLR